MHSEDILKELNEKLNEIKKAIENNKKQESKLKSRKFWITIIFGFGYPILYSTGVQIPSEAVMIVVAYLLGQSSVDVLKEWAKSKSQQKS